MGVDASSLKTVLAQSTPKIQVGVKASSDGMKLFMELTPQPEWSRAEKLTTDELLKIISERVSTEDLDLRVLEEALEIVNSGGQAKERRIKKGIPPTPGADGRFVFLVKKFTGVGAINEDTNGLQRFLEQHLFDNILKEQVVARVYPPKEGVPGRDVFGSSLNAKPGSPIKIALDKSLQRRTTDAGYEEIYSGEEGYLLEENGKLQIRTELQLPGHVDYHLGNIHFVGRVIVSGDIRPGFLVDAAKGVEVRGEFQKGSINAPSGDVILKGFAIGGEGSRIIAGGSFYATRSISLDVEAQGDITFKESQDGVFRTEGGVFVERSFVGGEVLTVSGIEAEEIGHDTGRETTVTLCSAIETRSEFRKILQLISQHDQALHLLKLHLGPYATSSRTGMLQEPLKQKIEKMLAKFHDIEASRARLSVQKKNLLLEVPPKTPGYLSFRKALHAGVKIRSGSREEIIPTTIVGPKTLKIEESPTSPSLYRIEDFCSIERKSSETTLHKDSKRKTP